MEPPYVGHLVAILPGAGERSLRETQSWRFGLVVTSSVECDVQNLERALTVVAVPEQEQGDTRLQIHTEKPTRFIAGCLDLVNPLPGPFEVTCGNVAIKLDGNGPGDGFPEPLHDGFGQPLACLAV